ncbi:hypothetical protein A3H03_02890 [Candidatus Kuenenbacteria bacterium RIFCSPLOWO2_12_FULL_42_13]|uniref:DUF7670 domain-containing protein n=3 Tax=Candidatus Kueneniibacteriota TaxID=1752740 RepID=A0A0G0Z0P6_9BACT|nr:MAG: hypothetical protein UV02_C0017G0009 [Candidatus Kuenenbacteria bacterium GW2011_GWA2_42_15]OGG91905.1 MAG: hypothetical protein A3H03_02890 [Candidatus Kuenenbacteria bacterium RIFCSPLOWO2_12_FULL_42_13]OGG98523.1 MAG: hypothetical protein A3E04_00470 [Candidatus Kuenenbacteria bacterium RIFCSPHIGHO2_12_FULL_42_14]
MKNKKIIYWLPRILSLAFVAFLSLFSFDVFEAYSGWQAILALAIHLFPALILLGVVAIAWKYDLVGVIIFLGLAVFYVLAIGFNRPWSWYAGISGPAVLVGILFLLSWFKKRS